ncbi:hypothetical protein LCI18_006652 [Fusarium solani-melongenae]|uniref:Uncharacterized protein n=1 Tax=Fusarium solani subsp. cucurbitae TaxID=2747967 RepID=A0ACD3Z3D5_FUSSC|nr:hypothetical protein LCI18_006652 [Fusarium solani-melongenae]
MFTQSGGLAHLWAEFSTTTALSAGAAAFVLYAIGLVIYRVYLHPLAKYPGPFWAKITEWYALYFVFTGRDTKKRYEWSVKYGNILRVGPNELQFNDVTSVKEIYGQGSAMPEKDAEFYSAFSFTGIPNILSSATKVEHSRIRRLVSHAFSFQNVLNCESRVAAQVDKFLHIIDNSAQPVEAYDLIHHLFLDTISELSFDQVFGCLDGHMVEEALGPERVALLSTTKGKIPFIEWIPLQFVKEALAAQPRMIKFATDRVRDLLDRINNGKSHQSSLLERMIKENRNGESFTEQELVENAIIFIGAGAGTSHISLAYLLWHVDQDPAVRKRLEDEIRSAFPDPSVMPDFKTLSTLPYLDCVLSEVLRLRGPLASLAPRISPGKTISGEYISKGTKVSSLPYCTHRHAEVFPDPWKFDPSRWLEPTPEMKTMWRPFSLGPRNCIGLHLAKMQIFVAAAALYLKYDIRVDDSITEDMMDMEDRGILSPRGKELKVFFTKRF